MIKPIKLTPINVSLGQIIKKTGLIFSSVGNRDQYAGFLAHIPDNFCFISTDYVGLQLYKELDSILSQQLYKLLLLTTKELEQLPTCWTLRNLALGLVILIFTAFMSYQVAQETGAGSIERRIEQLKSELTQERAKSTQLAAEIQKKKQEKSVSQPDFERWIERKKDAKIAELTRQIEQTQQGKAAEIAELMEEKVKADWRIRELETQLASLGQQVEGLMTEIQKKEQEKSVSQRDLEQQVEQIKRENDAKIAKLTRQIEQTQQEKEAEIAKLTEEKVKAGWRTQELKNQLASLGQQVEELKAENSKLKLKRKLDRTPDIRQSFGVSEIDQAVADLQYFLRQRAVNVEGKTTEEKNLEEFLQENRDNPQSFYIKKYCADFLSKRQTLVEAIEENKETISRMPDIPENYCEAY